MAFFDGSSLQWLLQHARMGGKHEISIWTEWNIMTWGLIRYLLQDSASTGSLPYFGGSLAEIDESTKIGLIGAYWSKWDCQGRFSCNRCKLLKINLPLVRLILEASLHLVNSRSPRRPITESQSDSAKALEMAKLQMPRPVAEWSSSGHPTAFQGCSRWNVSGYPIWRCHQPGHSRIFFWGNLLRLCGTETARCSERLLQPVTRAAMDIWLGLRSLEIIVSQRQLCDMSDQGWSRWRWSRWKILVCCMFQQCFINAFRSQNDMTLFQASHDFGAQVKHFVTMVFNALGAVH